jgi:hypothetical protein
MKNLVLGLVLGAVITGVGSYLAYPKIKQAAYDEGYSVGNKEGIAKGTETGIEEGIAQGAAKQMAEQKIIQDSLNNIIEKEKAARAVKRKPVEEKPKIQNWHVLGGAIAEPILDEPATDKKAE